MPQTAAQLKVKQVPAVRRGGHPLPLLSDMLVSKDNVLGIDIGSSYVKVLQLQKSVSRYSVRNCMTKALPQAARENPAEKRRLVQEYVRDFIKEWRIRTTFARISVSGKGVFIFSLTVPQMNKKDMRGAVGIEFKKRLPAQMDIASISYDFFVTGPADEKGVMVQVTCIAVERAIIDDQVQLIKEMGLTPVGVFTVPDCLGSLLPGCLDPQPKGTVVLLDIGALSCQLNFYKGQNLIFSREIPIGGDHFTMAMAKNLSLPGQPAISLDDAEKLKRNWGIPLDEEAKADFLTDFGQFKGEQITMMLRPVLERLVMEITRTIGYYVKTFKSDRIEELYLTGGSSRLKNIDKFLLFNVEGIQKVQPLNILKPVKGWSERLHQQELVMEQAAPHMAVAFGLCMGSGGKVNMLPAKEKLEQKANLLSMLLKFAFPAVLVLNLVFYSGVYFNGVKYKMFVGKLDSDISRLEPVAQKVREYRAQSQKLTEKAQLLERAKGTQPSWLGVMRELSALVPQEISLTRIVTEEKTKPVRIRISGVIFPPKYTIADLALSQFVMTLEESPFFRQVELVSVRKNTDSQVASADFEIRCALNY